jgi:tRNA pseudouridine13 synthase
MRPPALFQTVPEDFVVDEVDAYPAVGAGPHTFIRVRKRDLTTEQAVTMLADALGRDRREAGFAGQKDRVAIATQRISFPDVDPDAALALAGRWPELEVLEATRHDNKLKPGHLRANRFVVTLRGIAPDALGSIEAGLTRIFTEGMPNAFGPQRFGRDGDNADRALAFVRGQTRPPGDPRLRRLLFSALQARWFNAVLARRIDDGTWNQPLAGDLLKKHQSGGMFRCEDVETDRARARAGELSPTGPMFGAKMAEPGEPVRSFELAVLEQDDIEPSQLRAHKSLGEGARRPLRVWIEDGAFRRVEPAIAIAAPGVCLEVTLTLPKGVYASTALGEVVSLSRPRSDGRATSPDSAAEPADSSPDEGAEG